MDDENGFKLLLSYNIKGSDMQAYYEFVLGHYIPIMQSLGLEMSEAWHTEYGNYPIRLIGFVSRNEETMMKLLADETWEDLNEKLEEFVTDFTYKVVPYTVGFRY
ncbi:MAG: hypothetical protein WAM60_17805 [Candidatus Promineifilaceae bacterium]